MPKDLAVIFQSRRKSLQKKANKRELERTWFSMVFWALGIPFEVETFLLQWKYSCSFRIQLCLRSLCLWCGRHLLGWNLLVFPLLCSVVMISVLHCLSLVDLLMYPTSVPFHLNSRTTKYTFLSSFHGLVTYNYSPALCKAKPTNPWVFRSLSYFSSLRDVQWNIIYLM